MKEIWKDIPGYEGLYQASNLGRIKSAKRETTKGGILITNNKVYPRVRLSKNGKAKNENVHRLIAKTFYGESKLQVDHIDGNKLNNRLDNLEYVTPKENTNRAWKKGLAKVNWEVFNKAIQKHKEISSIKIVQYDLEGNFIKEWDSISDASRFYKIPASNICNCCKNKRNTCNSYKWQYK